MALRIDVSDAPTFSGGDGGRCRTGQDQGGGEMRPLSGRPKTMVALVLALVLLLSGCPKGASGDTGGGGYRISISSAPVDRHIIEPQPTSSARAASEV